MKTTIINIDNFSQAKSQLAQIGVSNEGIEILKNKFFYFNIKFFDVSIIAANILKQELISLGGDCALHKHTISGKIKKSDLIIFANLSQLKYLTKKLKNQSFKEIKHLNANLKMILQKKLKELK